MSYTNGINDGKLVENSTGYDNGFWKTEYLVDEKFEKKYYHEN